ncbi:DNA primase [uncultured phage_Deep-GF0-KM16-C193]|uniref:DNA helicase/primase n=1 Tax=uncultured phage_Deep-GF0-KM16-C193 TaxID=2740799 RepID=A0A1B1IWP2_9CAUD|nr:DNA primase [uncultured phage_Deep-GF0-KM16-C193]ANS05753.1 DNA primase [uncultured phage_Deep-GF0-KM16-C193]
MTGLSEEKFLGHAPCNNCGSRDNLAIYQNHSYCFGCKIYIKHNGQVLDQQPKPKTEFKDMITGITEALPRRKINSETCKVFNYETGTYNNKQCHIANYYDKNYNKVAQHLRFSDKSFIWLGDTDEITLFGQPLWRDGGRMVVITEGEIDAMSISQCQNNKYPVVSVPSGSASAKKYIKRELEWLSKFESIILMLDNDEAGVRASVECANLLPVKKVKIARLQAKDPNELLQKNKGHKIIEAVWEAKTYTPQGIITGQKIIDLFYQRKKIKSVPYCWNGLNKKLSGIRLGELNLICAGTGTGKSAVCREIASHLLLQGHKVGYIALEEDVQRSIDGLVSVLVNAPIHKDEVREKVSKELLDKQVKFISDKVSFYKHLGSSDVNDLLNRIRYMVQSLDCEYIFLDHIGMIVSGITAIESSDERRLIDNIMTQLRQLVSELNCAMFVVSHLRRPEGKTSHEEGLQVSLSHLRGSHSLATLSNQVISFERNQQSETENNILTVRVLKNRFSGDTGIAGTLLYNKETGRLSEGDFDE